MDWLKKSIKLIVATLITLTIGVTVSSTAQAATVHYVDYDKTTENIRNVWCIDSEARSRITKYWYSSKHCFSSLCSRISSRWSVLSEVKQDASYC